MLIGSVASAVVAATLAGQTPSEAAPLPPLFLEAQSAISDVCLPIVEAGGKPDALITAAGFVVDNSPQQFVRDLTASNDRIYRSKGPGEPVYIVIEPTQTSTAETCVVTVAASNPMFMDSLRRRLAAPQGRFVEDPGNTWPSQIISMQATDKISGRYEKIVAAAGPGPESGLMRTSAVVLRVDPPSNAAELKDIKQKCAEGEITSALLCGKFK